MSESFEESLERRVAIDVDVIAIARVYAEALLNAAEKHDKAESIGSQLHDLCHTAFDRHLILRDFFSGRMMSRDNAERVIRKVFEGRVDDVLLDFLFILNRHDRNNILAPIAQVYRDLVDQRARRVRVTVISAVPISDEQRSDILTLAKDRLKLDPVLEERIDRTLLGGLIVRVGDMVYDCSVKNRLNVLKHKLIARSTHEIQRRRDRLGSSV